VNKPASGVLTFGATPAPITIYEGQTGRVALQLAFEQKGSSPRQGGGESEPTVEKADSIGNVSRGDRTPIELFLRELANWGNQLNNLNSLC
jgi:hypothetical protein